MTKCVICPICCMIRIEEDKPCRKCKITYKRAIKIRDNTSLKEVSKEWFP